MNNKTFNHNGNIGRLLTLSELHELRERAAAGEKFCVFCKPINDWAQVRSNGLVFHSKDGEYGFVWPKIDEGYGTEILAYVAVETEAP